LGAGHHNRLSIRFVFYASDSFGSGNVAPASFPISNINKGRWSQYDHKKIMQEYEKYGNN
jgi:hypothetical protein